MSPSVKSPGIIAFIWVDSDGNSETQLSLQKTGVINSFVFLLYNLTQIKKARYSPEFVIFTVA